jgi:hypothetical protein
MANRASSQVDEIKAGQSGAMSVVNPMAYIAPFSLSGTQLVYADWVLAQISGGNEIAIFYPAGTALPIVLPSFQTIFPGVRFPKVSAKMITGQGVLTGTLVGGTGYTNGTYTGKALTGGSGNGAIATIVVAGGIITSVTITTPGKGYVIGDTLSASGLGAGTLFSWTVLTAQPPTFTYLDGATILTTEVTVGLPDTVSIDVDNAGGVLGDNILLTISGAVGGVGGAVPGSSTPYPFTQADLVAFGSQFYLPLTLPSGKRPIYVESNGIEVITNYNSGTSKLYGFANNSAQTIVVYVI